MEQKSERGDLSVQKWDISHHITSICHHFFWQTCQKLLNRLSSLMFVQKYDQMLINVKLQSRAHGSNLMLSRTEVILHFNTMIHESKKDLLHLGWTTTSISTFPPSTYRTHTWIWKTMVVLSKFSSLWPDFLFSPGGQLGSWGAAVYPCIWNNAVWWGRPQKPNSPD